jgi:hypothetical protein
MTSDSLLTFLLGTGMVSTYRPTTARGLGCNAHVLSRDV